MESESNISPKQERLIVALLQERTVEDACRTARVGISTHWRWVRDEAFLNRYRDARRALLENAVTKLQTIASDAVSTLEKNLSCESPSVQVRSASTIMALALKGAELLDLDSRLRELELIIAGRNNE